MATQSDQLVLGIDGGGTHTRAALVDASGRLCGLGAAGPSNYQSVGIEVAERNIAAAVAEAWREAGGGRSGEESEGAEPNAEPVAGAFLGMAGVVSAADRRRIEEIAERQRLARRVAVDHDIRTALAGGLAGAPGIALIAGTGSSCYGRRADGIAWRSGGWGARIDDAGGGHWLGIEALSAITRAYDGRSEPTALAAPIMERLGIDSMDHLLHLLGEEGLSKSDIAALAPIVLNIASYGDRVAKRIVALGADELARMVEAVMLRLAWDSTAPVMICGGLTTDRLYVEAIRGALERRAPRAELVPPLLPAVLGAALLALELTEIAIDEDIIEHLRHAALRVDAQ